MNIKEKTLNAAPGFLCPACKSVRIQLSLQQFLSTTEVRCPVCNTAFLMDKSGCTELVQMLQKLHVAHQNLKLLQNPKL
jgi:transcription elongation factor Elf1